MARPIGIRQDDAGPDGEKRRVDVHGIGIAKRERVHAIPLAEMTPHPLDSKPIGHLAALNEDIATAAHEIGGVERGLVLGRDERTPGGQSMPIANRFNRIIEIVEFVRHRRLGSGRPTSAASKIILDERTIGTIFEEATSPRHRRFDDLVADDDHEIARHRRVHARRFEVGRFVDETPIDDVGSTNDDAFAREYGAEVLDFDSRSVDEFARERLAAAFRVHGPIPFGRVRFHFDRERRNARVVDATDDDFFEGIPFVVTAHGGGRRRCRRRRAKSSQSRTQFLNRDIDF